MSTRERAALHPPADAQGRINLALGNVEVYRVEHRQGLAEKRPVLPDFRSSGRLERDADQVWFLFRPSMYEARPEDCHWGEYGELILGKMRDGQRGLIVPCRFLEPYALIEDWPGDWERPVGA